MTDVPICSCRVRRMLGDVLFVESVWRIPSRCIGLLEIYNVIILRSEMLLIVEGGTDESRRFEANDPRWSFTHTQHSLFTFSHPRRERWCRFKLKYCRPFHHTSCYEEAPKRPLPILYRRASHKVVGPNATKRPAPRFSGSSPWWAWPVCWACCIAW